MDNLVIASSEADADAAAAVEQHHAELAGALAAHVERVLEAASAVDRPGRGGQDGTGTVRETLVRWARADLVPHALAEEREMYPAARATEAGRLLVDGMLAEHEVLVALVEEVAGAADDVRAAGAARALAVLFESHLAKENQLLMPLLAATPGVSVAAMLDRMHGLLGAGPAGSPQEGCGGPACSCGETDASELPELDSRAVPHAIRHATIFGALDAAPPGGGLVLAASHDPLPLLAQLEQRVPGGFDVDYLERGPEVWRLRFLRR